MNKEFITISDILNNGLFDSKKGSNAIKYSTIFSFWPQIAGKKFQNSSKPHTIKFSKMYISCENSFVVQELIMYKQTLLQKLKIYCEPLGVNISDFVFDYKNWSEIKTEQIEEEFAKFYSDDELESVAFDEENFLETFKNIDRSEYLNGEQKTKFKDRIIKLQKAKMLRLS